MRSLFEERLEPKFHMASRQMPVYFLTVAKGTYTFALGWTPSGTAMERAAAGDSEPVTTLPMALHEQLGLELKSGKVTDRVLVVDHAQAPSLENLHE